MTADAGAPNEPATLTEPPAPKDRDERTTVSVPEGLEEGATAGPGSVQSFDLREADWTTVSVTLPPDCPADPTLELVALYPAKPDPYDDEEDRAWLVNELLEERGRWFDREDGEFAVVRIPDSLEVRVPHPAMSTEALFVLRGRYLHLDAKRVELPIPGDRVVLAPQFGAWLTGRFVVPSEAEARELSHDDFHAYLARWSLVEGSDTTEFDHPTVDVPVWVRKDLTYEARGLPTNATYTLRVSVDGLLKPDLDEIELQPGEHKVLDVTFEPGASIVGRVTDKAGQGIAGVEVFAINRGEDAESDAEGYFAVHGLHTGEVTLRATAPGWLENRAQVTLTETNARIEGCDIQLDRGAIIAGEVREVDGTPTAGAFVFIYEQEEGYLNLASQVLTDLHGRFEVGGLVGGPFEVVARPGSERQPADPAREGAEDQDVGSWATAIGVAPNTTNLVLVLRRHPHVLALQVVDDSGAPVESFKVDIGPRLGDGLLALSPGEAIDGTGGSFRLPGLFPGEWLVGVRAEGFSNREGPILVTLPQGDTTLVFTLHRIVSVSGVVVDPVGNPVPGAYVSARAGGRSSSAPFPGSVETTDEAGCFAIERGGLPGMVLVARHDKWVASERVPIPIAQGRQLENLVLRLRKGGRITGEVRDEKGKPVAGRQVAVMVGMFEDSAVSEEDPVVTDSSGRFAFDHVTPGRLTVMTWPSDEDIEAAERADETGAVLLDLMGRLVAENVELKDGEQVHVILAQTARDPVHVRGHVTRAGKPWTEGLVSAKPVVGSPLTGLKLARVDEQGGYDLVVDRPGRYVLEVADEDGNTLGLELHVEVPEAKEFYCDIVVPSGSISGRVYSPDGSPLPRAIVHLSREDGIRGFEDLDPGGRCRTAEDGGYVIEKLQPGTYSVHVTELADFISRGDPDARGRYGCAVVPGIRISEDEAVANVDIRLSPAGTLRGVVRDAEGKPVAGASVFVRDDTGRLVSNFSLIVSDALGKYEHRRLAPGPVTVSAEAGELTCADLGPVTITAGGTAECDFRLSPGVFLEISVLEGGDPKPARLLVLDEKGRQITGRLSNSTMQAMLTTSRSVNSLSVGPVSPGVYQIRATTGDGREANETVHVEAGQGTRVLNLRLQ